MEPECIQSAPVHLCNCHEKVVSTVGLHMLSGENRPLALLYQVWVRERGKLVAVTITITVTV